MERKEDKGLGWVVNTFDTTGKQERVIKSYKEALEVFKKEKGGKANGPEIERVIKEYGYYLEIDSFGRIKELYPTQDGECKECGKRGVTTIIREDPRWHKVRKRKHKEVCRRCKEEKEKVKDTKPR